MTALNTPAKLAWTDAHSLVRDVNPLLADKIDMAASQLTPDQRFVYIFNYEYGELIINDGKFVLPLYQNRLESDFRAAVNGSAIPPALLLSNTAEVFTELTMDNQDVKVVPLRLLSKGEWFGVFEYMNEIRGRPTPAKWKVSSGTRSAVLCVRTRASAFMDALRNNLDMKKQFSSVWDPFLKGDTWPLLKQLALRSKTDWHCRVLVLPSHWLDPIDLERLNLRYEISLTAWDQCQVLLDYTFFESLLRDYMFALHKRKYIKGNIVEAYGHLTQILAVAKGEALAFTPIRSDVPIQGPFQECQSVLSNALQSHLKHHPIILQLSYLKHPGDSGIHSFSAPTILNASSDSARGCYETFQRPLMQFMEQSRTEELFTSHKISPFVLEHFGTIRPNASKTNNRKSSTKKKDEFAEKLRNPSFLSHRLSATDNILGLSRKPGKKIDISTPFLQSCAIITLLNPESQDEGGHSI